MAMPKYTLLVVALVASGAAALILPAKRPNSAPEARAESPRSNASSKPSAPLPALPPEGGEAAAGTAVSGQVLEQIDVDKYSYLRVGEPGSQGTWTAVPVTSSQLGKRVRVTSAQMMSNFTSTTLKRTFDVIYFGVLDGDSGQRIAESQKASPHEGSESPHVGAGAAADKVPLAKVKRAEGPLGHTVAELAEGKSGGQKVRVRGIVVKQTPGVFGKTFLHLRDGSGSADNGTNDLAVTTDAEPAVGSEVLLEGTLTLDKDFGSGYRYHVLLADAVPVQP